MKKDRFELPQDVIAAAEALEGKLIKRYKQDWHEGFAAALKAIGTQGPDCLFTDSFGPGAGYYSVGYRHGFSSAVTSMEEAVVSSVLKTKKEDKKHMDEIGS